MMAQNIGFAHLTFQSIRETMHLFDICEVHVRRRLGWLALETSNSSFIRFRDQGAEVTWFALLHLHAS